MSTAHKADVGEGAATERTALLRRLAARYVWWRTPDEAMTTPDRLIAQVMNIGDFDDAQALAGAIGDDAMRAVLRRATVGQFNGKSWSYWHYRLGLTPSHLEPPPMPIRTFA